jgi:hypothetical protein
MFFLGAGLLVGAELLFGGSRPPSVYSNWSRRLQAHNFAED